MWSFLERLRRSRDDLLIASAFDECLAPPAADGFATAMLPEAASALRAAAGTPGVQVAIFSGRRLCELSKLCAQVGRCWVVAEHGAVLRTPLGEVERLVAPPSPEALQTLWNEAIDVAHSFAGTAVEPKANGVALHFGLDAGGSDRALRQSFRAAVMPMGTRVLVGSGVIEAQLVETDTRAAMARILSGTSRRASLVVTRPIGVRDSASAERAVPAVALRARSLGRPELTTDALLAGPPEVATVFRRVADAVSSRWLLPSLKAAS
jgi:trehalose-6-phosphatase